MNAGFLYLTWMVVMNVYILLSRENKFYNLGY